MKFILNKDNLIIEELGKLNAGSIGYYEASIEYDEQWNNLIIVAVMVKKGELVGKNISVINNKIYIDENLNGTYSIGFIGYTISENGEKTYQISSDLKNVYFNKGAGEIQTQNSEIPTASEWEIYIKQLKTIVDDMKVELHNEVSIIVEKDLNEKLQAGEFNGKSAYEIAIINGFKGTEEEWLASLTGGDGDNGATFTPNVDNDGNLSWSNDKGLENPATINIKGEKGDAGSTFSVATELPAVNSEGYSVLTTNTKYYLGEVAELPIEFPDGELGDEIEVNFISGYIATSLNINNKNINATTPAFEMKESYGYTINAKYGLISVDLDGIAYNGWNIELKEYSIVNKHLPYVELECIEATGTQYIDTGIAPADIYAIPAEERENFYFDIKFELNEEDDPAFIFGAYQSDSYLFRLFKFEDKFTIDHFAVTRRIQGGTVENNKIYNFRVGNGYIENLDTGERIIDEVKAGSVLSTYWYNIQNNVYIFADYPTNDSHPASAMKLYSFKFFNGREMVRDFVPCKKLDGTVCLFDKISNSFFYNQGEGEFVSYTELEYIEATGEQWINTEFNLFDNIAYSDGSINIKFSLTDLSTLPMNIYSAYESDSSTVEFFIENSNTFKLYQGSSINVRYGISVQNPAPALDTIYNWRVRKREIFDITNDTTISSWDDYGKININAPLYLLSKNGSTQFAKARLYSVKVKQDYSYAENVLDLIPVKDSKGTVCMFDKVSRKFFYNQGTGDFIAGPEV